MVEAINLLTKITPAQYFFTPDTQEYAKYIRCKK